MPLVGGCYLQVGEEIAVDRRYFFGPLRVARVRIALMQKNAFHDPIALREPGEPREPRETLVRIVVASLDSSSSLDVEVGEAVADMKEIEFDESADLLRRIVE